MNDRHRWRVRLTASAEADYRNILRWTAEQFGTQHARRYARTLECAIAELTERPDVPGSRERPEIGPGIRVLHVARHGRRGRHFLLYRISSDEELLLIDVRVYSTTAWTCHLQESSRPHQVSAET